MQREPTMGVCEWQGSCTLRCEQINVCGYIRTLQKQCLNSIWIHSLIQTRWASRHVEKGVCWSAVLMLESRKFSSISFQNTRNDECPRGVNFRILALGRLYARIGGWKCIYYTISVLVVIYIGVGFALSFLDDRQCESLKSGNDIKRTPTLFLYLCLSCCPLSGRTQFL